MSFEKELETRIASMNANNTKKTILLIDGEDKRAIAASKLIAQTELVNVILLVENNLKDLPSYVKQEIVSKEKQEAYAKMFFELRNGKETMENAQKALTTLPFYAMMMLKNKEVDGVVGGLNFTTADILRAAFKVIGPKKGIKTISSAMIMHKEDQKYIFSDISVNIKPSSEQLAEIGINANDFAKSLGFDPKVAFLSFSTDGSAVSEESALVANATHLYNEKNVEKNAIGEIQFDAAFDKEVRKSKYKKDSYSEDTNVFVFPDLNAGNIGYKIAQRLGNFGAIGPVITGIAAPVNDLSRGSTTQDVYNTILITALQSVKGNE
ncbi:phosphate acetyltransferase [Mesomycoplasma lagogenitalium]|uniref:Phosphate acetyltransferase n=1 Tax=Mesomycoplasma lagogenitalium TaxID=171286 RepID=A0ABY8LV27_9BACT|nr:phosphate acetyltransferase [Mesomycoplasma lagogenitalium]WGI36301.1 phosphate acetyltransferase [Mesomycoplasma lagogenitalium]